MVGFLSMQFDPRSWFLATASADYADLITDCAFELLAEGGYGLLTHRRLAERAGTSASWVCERFTRKERLLGIISDHFGKRWVRWIALRRRRSGLLALLPETDDDVVATRVWLALMELGRVEPHVAFRIHDVRRAERRIVLADLGATQHAVDEVIALIEGLRVCVADPARPLSPTAAADILRTRLAQLDQR